MSKLLLSPEWLKQLKRDGVRSWLGKSKSEIVARIRAGDDSLHMGMLADWIAGDVQLPAGRPTKTAAERAEPSEADKIRVDYRALRNEGKTREEAIVILASDNRYNKHRDTIEHAINRKSTRK